MYGTKYYKVTGLLFFMFVSFLSVLNVLADNTWNNNNYINDSFWRQNPTDSQIKDALFGNANDTKTAYTQEWSSNVCSTGNINIINIQNYATSGINSLPQDLAANTIYILNSGNYISSGQLIYGGNCIAVIGKGIVKIYTDSGTSTAMFRSTGKENIILSDMRIDGLGDGLGNIRYDGNYASGNSYGIYFYTTKNSTINSVSVYNNKHGMQIEKNENTLITNSLAYNNSAYGITLLTNTGVNYIHNTQVFNNNNVGFNISNSTGQILSNSQFYNNKFNGIVFNNVKNSVISNCMSYNNSRYGIRFQSNSSNNIINNSWFFNNNTTGVFLESGTNNKFYGSIKLFNNASSSSANTLVGGISAGTNSDYEISGLGRNDGTIDTGLTVGYPYITNPRTNDGRNLISSTSRSSTNRSSKFRTGIEFVSFLYGSGLLKQTRTISYNGTDYSLGNFFYDINRYISQIEFTNTNPDVFLFADITGAVLNQTYTSNIVTLGGMDNGTYEYVSLVGFGSIYKNGINIGTSGTGSNNDQFYIEMISSSNYNTIMSGTFFVGTTYSDFIVATQEQIIDDIPENFTFESITGSDLGHIYFSNTIILTGMDSLAVIPVSLSGEGIIYKNGINIGTGGTGSIGDQFYIEIISSSNYRTTITGDFLANVISSSFSVTTKPDLIFPSFSGVVSGTTYSEPVSIIFSDSNLSGATLNGNPYSGGTIISAEGYYIFEVSDTAGNFTGATFRISIPKVITITFDSDITTGVVIKAPIKYNKDVAYGMVFDDGLDDGYQPAFKYLMGGQISGRNTNFIAPGLYYTDGAGNDVAFRGGYAWYSVNSAFTDLHVTTPSYIKWTELKETYLNGRDILNHGRSNAAYPSSGQVYNYPDNPPGSTGLDYDYEIRKNYEYVRDRIGLSGVYLTHFILPSGDPAYTQPARDQGYKSVSSQGTNNGVDGINIFNNIDLHHFMMHRKYVTSQNSNISNVMDDINTLMSNSSSSDTKLWRHAFTHGVVFTGNNNGGMQFDLWKYMMDGIANNYGKNGNDNIRFAGPQEVYEYIATKQATNINTIISGNQLIINIDTLNMPNDLRKKSLSLLVTGTNANISSIDYQNGAFTYHSENKDSGLINVEMGDYYLTDRDPDSFSLNNITGATGNISYASNTITLSGMSEGLENLIYLSGSGELYKNGINIGTGGTGKNGDQFYILLNSSTGSIESISTELHIGPESSIFSITNSPSIIYSTTGATNGNVTATFLISSGTTITNNGGNNDYIFTDNGSFTFNFVDGLGNTGSATATVNRIDKTKPNASIFYSTTGATNGNVIVKLTGYSESIVITNNGGNNTYTFTDNGSFTFNFIDGVGNTGNATATVTWIEEITIVDSQNNGGEEIKHGTGKIILTGGTSTGVEFNWSGTIVIDNLNGDGSLELNTSGVTITSSGDRNMLLLAPNEIIKTNYGYAEFGEPGIPSRTEFNKTRDILTTIEAGSTGAEITITGGQNFRITIIVDSGVIGSELKIYRSNDGYNWIENEPDKICILSGDKSCSFYTNHLSYFTAISETTTSNGGGNNIGGGIKLIKDLCPSGDYSQSYYDNICGDKPKEVDEFKEAYKFSYENGITTKENIISADMDGVLIRIDLAKMIVNYAINILGKTIDQGNQCVFDDINQLPEEMKTYATKACQLGLMGVNTNNKFNPNSEITRAEFGTVLSRLLRGEKYNSISPIRYKDHLDVLKKDGIMKNISSPMMKELRGYVMLMLMRVKGK